MQTLNVGVMEKYGSLVWAILWTSFLQASPSMASGRKAWKIVPPV
jgi:hypothetical protein